MNAKKFFATNEHIIERGLRIAIGLGVLSLVFVGPKSLWGLIGIVPIMTGLMGSCPMYSVLGISTCPIKKRRAKLEA